MLCAASAARDAFLLSSRARDNHPGAIVTRGGATEKRKSFYPRRKANVASAVATGKAGNSTSSSSSSSSASSSSQYLDALQSLLREAREDGIPVAADDKGDGGGRETAAVEEEEAPWSLSDSAAFLSAALGPPAPAHPPSSGSGDGNGGVSVEEAQELLLKTGWRRSRGGGRFQARERSKARMTGEAAVEEGEATTTATAAATTTTAVPSPSALSATLSALREHAGLGAMNESGSGSASSSLARAVRRCPSLLALSPNQVALSAAFLRSLGLDAADVAVACSREPRLLGFGVAESMAPVATFLRSKRVGMRAEDVARLAVSAPTVLGLSVERSLEPRVAFLERALSSSSSSSVSQPPNPLLAKVLRSAPSLLHLSLRSGEETLAELERRLPDAAVRSRAIAAAPAMLLVGAERLAATLEALASVASLGLDDSDDKGDEGGADSEEADDDDEQQRLLVVSDLVRRHPSLLRHAFTGPDAVMLPAADWLARLLSVVEAEEATPPAAAAAAAEEEAGAARKREQGSEGRRKLLSLADLPPSSTPRGRALAAAAIRRCPALLGRSLSGLEGTASWLEERARVFLSSSSSSAADSEDPDFDGDGAIKRETRGRKARSPESSSQTPLSLVAGVARRFPQAFGLARTNLDAKLTFLTEEVGMSEGEAAGAAVAKMPQLLGLRLRSLRARAAFLLDGNDEVGEGNEEGEEDASASAVKGGETRAKNKPVKGRRSASEIAAFAPCLASSLEKLVARHAAVSSAQRAPPKKKKTAKPKSKKKKGGGGEEQETEETAAAAAAATKKKKTPSLSSLLACTNSVLEGRLGLPLGSLEALKADGRVREAIERAERAAAAKEEEEEVKEERRG